MFSFAHLGLRIARKYPLQPTSVLYNVHCKSTSYSDKENVKSNERYALLFSKNFPKDISFRKASKSSVTGLESIGSQVGSILKDIKMKDMANAPPQAFWLNAVTLVPIAFPSLAYIVTGFHPSLYTLQITYSALLLAFQGGAKFGYDLENKEQMTWNNVPMSAIPKTIGFVSLLLSDVLSPLVLASGFLLSAYIDLTAGCFPPWYKAMRLAFVIPATISLLLAFLSNLFN